MTVAVVLDRDPERAVSVPLLVAERGGASAGDYSGVPAQVVFSAGQTSRTFEVAAAGDDVDDGGESIVIGLGVLPAGVSAGAVGETTVAFVDDDVAGVTVSESALSVVEGGSAVYSVVLESEPSAEVVVAVSGASGDVSVDRSSLRFTASDWSVAQPVRVSAAEDADAVVDAVVELSHSVSTSAAEYSGLSVSGLSVTVVENDTAALSVGGASAGEGAGYVVFEVSISVATSEVVTVDYATSDGTAVAGSDYRSVSGSLSFPANSVASQPVSVPVIDDSVDEAEEETFSLTLSGASGAVLAGGAATLSVTGTISDNDDPANDDPAVSVQPVSVPVIDPTGSGPPPGDGDGSGVGDRARFFSGPVIDGPEFCLNRSFGGPVTYPFDSDGDGIADVCSLPRTRRAAAARQNALELLAQRYFAAFGDLFALECRAVPATLGEPDAEAVDECAPHVFAASIGEVQSAAAPSAPPPQGSLPTARTVLAGVGSLSARSALAGVGSLSARSALAGVGSLSARSASAGVGSLSARSASAGDSTADAEPALRFTDEEYTLHPMVYLWLPIASRSQLEGADQFYTGSGPTDNQKFFDVAGVERENIEDADLRFAVEALPESSEHQFCYANKNFVSDVSSIVGCYDLNIGVLAQSGYLYVYTDHPSERWKNSYRVIHFISDYRAQPMELSVADTGSGLKVYREFMVNPPTLATGCDDYPDKNWERFNCLFNRPILPATPATTQSLRDALPDDLIQNSDNYSLIFEEQFNHSNDCDDGVADLDGGHWNYNSDMCSKTETATETLGERCEYADDGYFFMADGPTCSVKGIDTRGKLEFKYGYIEMKFTIESLKSSGYGSILYFMLGTNGNGVMRSRAHNHDNYGITVTDYEDLTTTLAHEIDILEYAQARRPGGIGISHQYVNMVPLYPNITPYRSDKRWRLCRPGGAYYEHSYNLETMTETAGSCFDEDGTEGLDQEVTVILGLEWSPRGYRTFRKVEGFEDSLEVVTKDKIKVDRYCRSTSSYTGWGRWVCGSYSGSARDGFFELLVAGDEDSVLEKVGVSHVSVPMHLGGWGNGQGERPSNPGMKIDYIRVFQPENHYSDMEPVFQ